MAELTPGQIAKLQALDPAEVAAEVKKGRRSIYQRKKMDYLIELNEKYKQQAELTETSVGRANILATERLAHAIEKSSPDKGSAIKLVSSSAKHFPVRLAIWSIVIGLLGIALAVAMWRFP